MRWAEMRRRAIDPTRIAGVTQIVYDDADRRGVRGLLVRNAAGLSVTFIVDRALDAAELIAHGSPLTWYGPGNASLGGYLDPSPDDFARTFFGGLVTTCGLDAFGPPGCDRYGSWPQHGHVNHMPAREVRYVVDWDGVEPCIEINGTIVQFSMFGESLRLERTWRVLLNENRITLHDRVTNDGGATVPHMVLYHCNVGFPLLDEATRWTIDVSATTPRDAEAMKGLDCWDRGGLPQPEFLEQVFVHQPRANASGWCTATATNPALARGMALAIAFRPDELPGLFSWRMLGYSTYVMAIEPANCTTVAGRLAAAKAGTLPALAPGQSRNYHLTFSVASSFGM